MRRHLSLLMCVTVAICVCGFAAAYAQDEADHKITAQEVAEALADPSATITYFNVNYRAYQNVGPFDDMNNEFRLNAAGFLRLPKETTVLYRAFLPFYITDFAPAPPFRFDDSGMGDALLSAYWVPTKGSLIVGPGLSMMAPTASEDYYGTGKWSAGPTLVFAKKAPGKYTIGGLATHVWSFAGDEDRANISMTTLMPALTVFLNRRGTALALGSETTYNWEVDENNWQVPLTCGLSQILPPFGKFFLGIAVAGSYYIEKSDFAPEWDVRGTVSIVMP